MLALLLGFTFSLALQRYDTRNEAVVEETNAIGTTYLRAQLLPASDRDEVRRLLRDYVEQRIGVAGIDLAHESDRRAVLEQSSRTVSELWRHAVKAAEDNPGPVTGLFIQALNQMIDAFGRRDTELARHVPEVVLFLLYGPFLITGIIVGYAAGVGGHCAFFVTYIMVGLIVLLVFIIIDPDRPRRGLIDVSQKSMIDLRASMMSEQGEHPIR